MLTAALILGLRHALEPDHLVAVSTLVAEERRLWPAARLEVWWGLGHMLPIAVVGLPLVAFRLELPQRWEYVGELGVGVLLVVLGVRTLWNLWQEHVHFHVHEHGGVVHAHFHRHSHGSEHDHQHPLPGRRGLISFFIGIVHGLAGSGAAAVLAMTAAPSLGSAAGYLLVFGLGNVVGMFVTTLCLAAHPAGAGSSWRSGSWRARHLDPAPAGGALSGQTAAQAPDDHPVVPRVRDGQEVAVRAHAVGPAQRVPAHRLRAVLPRLGKVLLADNVAGG